MNEATLRTYVKALAVKGLAEDAVQLGGNVAGDFADLLAEAGMELLHAHDDKAGIGLLEAACRWYPKNARLSYSLGTVYASQGKYEQALPWLRVAVSLSPDAVHFRYNLAFALEQTGLKEDAEAEYHQAWAAQPGYAKGGIGYARMLAGRHRYRYAVEVLRKTLLKSPADHAAAFALASGFIDAGDASAALIYYQHALTLLPEDPKTHSNFLFSLLMVPELTPDTIARELEATAGEPRLGLAIVNAARRLGKLDSSIILGFHRNFGRILEKRCWELSPSVCNRARPEEGRLRIGYISSDLYAHPVGHFLEGVLPHHDRSRFEVFVFSPFGERDGVTAFLKQGTEHWIVLDPNDRQASLNLLQDACLDILVDLSGHTAGTWIDLFVARPAPIQMTWVGYPATTGLDCMDYIIADRVALPPEDEAFYTEKPLMLPRSYVCFVPMSAAPAVGELPALHDGVITFGCFNTIHKLNSSIIKLWCRVLEAVPGSRLLLKAKGFADPDIRQEYKAAFEQEGIDGNRIEMEGFSPYMELLAAYQRVDIALDPFPYQGGMAVLDATWMGVPTLMLKGRRPPFVRHGETYLVQMGLDEWIADNEEEFVALATAWSSRLAELGALRSKLRTHMATAPFCDAAGVTFDLEQAFLRARLGGSPALM